MRGIRRCSSKWSCSWQRCRHSRSRQRLVHISHGLLLLVLQLHSRLSRLHGIITAIIIKQRGQRLLHASSTLGRLSAALRLIKDHVMALHNAVITVIQQDAPGVERA